MRSVALIGLTLGVVVGVDPFGWDEVGPLRWLLISMCGFAVVAASAGRVPRDRLTVTWAALLGWLAIAAVFGADRFHAWVGTPDRHFGWLTWLLCGALFVVARQSDSASRSGSRLVTQAVLVATLMGSAIAVAEAFGWRLAEVAFAGDRLGGSFSQPALLGAASILVLPICAAMVTDSTIHWRMLAVLATVGALFTLIAAQSRAAWLAAVFVGVVAVLARPGDIRRRWEIADGRRRAATGGVGIACLVVLALLFPIGSRLRALFGSGGAMAGRLDEWQVALRAVAARPLTGWGPEGYRIAFGHHVDVDYVVDHGRRVITDRAHSGLLDVAAIGGVPAGLLYVGLLGLVAVALVKVVSTGAPLEAGLALGALGYFAQQLVLFPLAELDPLAWLIAGLAIRGLPSNQRSFALPAVVRGLAAGLAGVALLTGVADVAADHRIARADSAAVPRDALRAADEARQLRGDSIRYDFIAGRLARRGASDISALDTALARVASGLSISPNDPSLRGEEAHLLLDRALATREPSDARTARSHLEALVADEPNHPEHVGRLGIARAVTGDENAAESAFNHAIRLDPDSAEHRQNLQTLLEGEKSP